MSHRKLPDPAENRSVEASHREEFDAEWLATLRRRFVVFVHVVGVVLIGLSCLAVLVVGGAHGTFKLMALSPAIGGVVMILMVNLRRLRGDFASSTLAGLLRRSTVMVVAAVGMQIPASQLVARSLVQLLTNAGLKNVQIGSFVPLLVSTLAVHLSASLVLPWTVRHALRPAVLICLIATAFSLAAPDPWPQRIGTILALFVMTLPGMLVSWLRFSQFRERVEMRLVRGRYHEVQRELDGARRIHEKLFPPAPLSTASLAFDFRYRPMRQIGGDFVDVIVDPARDAMTAILVDVTGHGIAAALAVNRLHGEIKRAVAQQGTQQGGAATPAQLIAALNEYIHLTLADESVYATAIVIRIDVGARRIEWCNAGHPPALLVRRDGTIQTLDSTAMMLGALPRDIFEPDTLSLESKPGDRLIAYTDGAIECRGIDGTMLGLSGFRDLVEGATGVDAVTREPSPSATLQRLIVGVQQFQSGPAEDDVLLLAIDRT